MAQTTKEHRRRVLGHLERMWDQFPDLRLCQLVVNISGTECNNNDVFYVEDERFLSDSAAFVEKHLIYAKKK